MTLSLPVFFFAVIFNVKNFGAKGNGITDDTMAFQKCIDALRSKGGGTMTVPQGNYPITFLKFFGKGYSDITITGDNANILQIIKGTRKSAENNKFQTFAQRHAADGCFVFDAQVSRQNDDSQSIKNIRISGLNFISDVQRYGFDELLHQISAHGVSNFIVENCTFTGFLGDGIAINGGTDFSKYQDAYNKEVIIRNCSFDGINKNNRQGVSIYYSDGFTIDRCSFKNTTRDDMPGAIDIEPDREMNVVRNGVISNCSFSNIGGLAAVVINQRKKIMADANSELDYTIINCKFTDINSPLAVIGNETYSTYYSSRSNIEMSNSTVTNSASVADIRRGYGIIFRDNIYENINSKTKNTVSGGAQYVSFINNVFSKVANPNGLAFSGKSKRINFIYNTFNNFTINAITINDPKAIGEISDNTFNSTSHAGGFPVVTSDIVSGDDLKNASITNNIAHGNFRKITSLYFFALCENRKRIDQLSPSKIFWGQQEEFVESLVTLEEDAGLFKTKRIDQNEYIEEWFYPQNTRHYYYRKAKDLNNWSDWKKIKK